MILRILRNRPVTSGALTRLGESQPADKRQSTEHRQPTENTKSTDKTQQSVNRETAEDIEPPVMSPLLEENKELVLANTTDTNYSSHHQRTENTFQHLHLYTVVQVHGGHGSNS